MSSKSLFHKKWLLLAGCLVLVVAVVSALELTNTTYIFHKKKVPATIPVVAQNKKPSSDSNNTPSGASSTPQKTSDKLASSSSSTPNANLAQPYGTLVSNHFPGQNNTSTLEQSTCNTTPGARCYIALTNLATNKTTRLPEQVVGSDGSTSWTWNANTLTSGHWQVTAVASLNGQTKAVTDSIKLEVK